MTKLFVFTCIFYFLGINCATCKTIDTISSLNPIDSFPAEVRERKNMVKSFTIPLILLHTKSLGYERQLSYHSGLHINVAFLLIFYAYLPGIATTAHFLNLEYRYYLRTQNSGFLYDFYPYISLWTIDSNIAGPGIGIGKQFHIGANWFFDFNIGVVSLYELKNKPFKQSTLFPKLGMAIGYKF